jgi:NTE family protein
MPAQSNWGCLPNFGLPVWRRPRLGLALGGGGACGYAHIGVLRVLERAGVPVDYLAGASMGGLIAAGSAMGKTADDMESAALAMNALSLLELPSQSTGLLEGTKLRQKLVELFPGEPSFGNARTPLRLVAVDVDNGEELVLGEGNLIDAIRATASFPGVFCPAPWNGRRMVDGGVRNNVPADVVRAMGAEVVVAVSVGLTTFQPLAPAISWPPATPIELLRRSPLFNVVERSLLIMEAEMLRLRLEKSPPDVLISPDLGSVRIESFDRAADAIAAGEQAAAAALEHIEDLMHPWFRPWLPG